jgi:hypothetical protein
MESKTAKGTEPGRITVTYKVTIMYARSKFEDVA